MRCMLLIALFAAFVATVSCTISVGVFYNFPVSGADGSYVWVTAYPSAILAYQNSPTALYGPSQFDVKCRAAGPSNSRAIVCSNGLYPDSQGGGNRTAFTYMNYGSGLWVPTDATGATEKAYQAVKPVYAFDLNAVPTPTWIKVANSPNEFITQGVNNVLAKSQNGNRNFLYFFGETAKAGFPINSGAYNKNSSVPNDYTWSGCYGPGSANVGLPQPRTLTCNDWTYNQFVSGETVFGSQGNPGSLALPYDSTTYSTVLYNKNAVGRGCNIDKQYIFCSWFPTNDDGILNGDETDVDCGGTTAPQDNKVGAGGLGATPSCGCTYGEYYINTQGACYACPINTYCRSSTGCQGSCLPCFTEMSQQVGTTEDRNNPGTFLTGQVNCSCTAGYQLPASYDVNVGPYDGSKCQKVVVGDPQITGLQGQDFQVHGIPDEFFNMISTPELQVNARFVYLDEAKCDNVTTCFTHPGTYIDQIGMMIEGQRVKVLAGSLEQGLRVFVEGKEIKVGTKKQLKSARVFFSSHRKVHVRTSLFSFAFISSDNFMNQEVALLDQHLAAQGAKKIVLKPGQDRPNADIPIHGIVGQTWQNIHYPENMFIEGAVADYRLGESDLFGTDFPFNKYQL